MLKANNNISYQGNVNIIYKMNGRKIKDIYKNSGTITLFTMIAKALAGYDISKQVPKLLRIIDKDGINIYSKYCPLTGVIYNQRNDMAYISCTCVLTASDLIVVADNVKEPQLSLTDIQGNILAYIDISKEAFSNISAAGVETDIVWELQFGNGTLLGNGE